MKPSHVCNLWTISCAQMALKTSLSRCSWRTAAALQCFFSDATFTIIAIRSTWKMLFNWHMTCKSVQPSHDLSAGRLHPWSITHNHCMSADNSFCADISCYLVLVVADPWCFDHPLQLPEIVALRSHSSNPSKKFSQCETHSCNEIILKFNAISNHKYHVTTLDFNVCLRSVDEQLRFCMFMNIPKLLIRKLEHCMTKIMTGLGGGGGGREEEEVYGASQ